MRVLMARPSLSDRELLAIREVFDSGWLGEGSLTVEFEAALRGYTGAPHAVAVNTGTSAIHLAMASRGIGPGDEVILPAFTFVSDAMAVKLCGATPVFADIDNRSLNLDPDSVARLITERTRVILPTDYAGNPANVDALREVIDRKDILLIRDASHSFGSQIRGRPVGLSQGEDATCFSFDPIKNLTCGEGGAILVGDDRWAEKLKIQRNLGFEHNAWAGLTGKGVKDRRVSMTGYRYHLGNLNAAIGLAQFQRLPELIGNRQRVARRYDEQLASVPAVECFERNYNEIAPFIYPVRVTQGARDDLADFLADRGIHAGLRYLPCHLHPLFQNSARADLATTERIARELLCLPIHAGLDDDTVDEVVDCLKGFFRHRDESAA